MTKRLLITKSKKEKNSESSWREEVHPLNSMTCKIKSLANQKLIRWLSLISILSSLMVLICKEIVKILIAQLSQNLKIFGFVWGLLMSERWSTNKIVIAVQRKSKVKMLLTFVFTTVSIHLKVRQRMVMMSCKSQPQQVQDNTLPLLASSHKT